MFEMSAEEQQAAKDAMSGADPSLYPHMIGLVIVVLVCLACGIVVMGLGKAIRAGGIKIEHAVLAVTLITLVLALVGLLISGLF